MGTTDNFDSSTATSVPSTATLPILLASNAGARTAAASLIAPTPGAIASAPFRAISARFRLSAPAQPLPLIRLTMPIFSFRSQA